MVPKWGPTWGSLNIRKKPIGASPLAPIEVWSAQVGSKNQSKLDQKIKSTWEGLLNSIFLDFKTFGDPTWGQVGRENRAKTGQDRTRQDRTRQDEDRTREGLVREREAEDEKLRGGGVCPAIRGRLS